MERYSRQIMLPEIGIEGQQRLLESSALIIGLGGLGAPVSTYLTGAGVGHIGLADNDTVSISNLQRQTLYSEHQTGLPKAKCAAQRLKEISSVTDFCIYPEGLTTKNAGDLIGRYDIVIDCTDNFATRYLIDDTCFMLGKPWVYGSIGEFHGQVTVFNFKNKRRYTDLYPDRETMCALPKVTRGVIGAIPGTIGSIQAAEALKILAGFGNPLDGRLLVMDLLYSTFDIINF